jgi:hypothetical protein
MLGAASVTLTALAVGWSTWAARPAEFVWVEAPVAAPAKAAPAQPRQLAAAPQATVPVAIRGRKHVQAESAAVTAPAVAPWTPTEDAAPLTSVSVAPAPPEGCGLPEPGERRLLGARGDWGPDARIRGTARWSVVEPGSAVRVYAAMTDPDGVPLVTDLTAFGSQSRYRVGCIRSHESRYRLFTSVVQNGDRLVVAASVKHDGRWVATGTLELASGQSGVLTLSDGREVSVVALARPETADEAASETREGVGRRFVDVMRVPLDI